MNDFESKWTQWKVKDTVKWFEYVLSLKYDKTDDDDYQIADLSESDDESDDDDLTDKDDNDDEKQDPLLSSMTGHDAEKLDYNSIEKQLLSVGFHAKTYLPLIQKWVQFRHYGFKNKQHCKLLCKYTKKLIEKYPKQRKKKVLKAMLM